MRIVFAEEDTLFSLMQVALVRALTPAGEKALSYFFGQDFSSPLRVLTEMADRLGLPKTLDAVICANDEAIAEALPSADVLVTEREPITRSRIESASRVQLIQKFGRDCGNIDLVAAREVGVKVANLVRLTSLSSADHVMALILALARNLFSAHRSVVARRDPSLALPVGRTLSGPAESLPLQFATDPPRTKFNWSSIRDVRVLAEHTLGLIGLGENSGEVARRARAFGMAVVYYKRHRLSAREEAELGGVRYVTFDELLGQSDFVSVHVPYSPDTEKMIGRDALSRMKRGAYLINTSRGGIVDEVALYDALTSNHIAAAALDVYRYEPVPPDCPLLELDRMIWTPHMAGGEPEFLLREVEDVLANIARVSRGEDPLGLVS